MSNASSFCFRLTPIITVREKVPEINRVLLQTFLTFFLCCSAMTAKADVIPQAHPFTGTVASIMGAFNQYDIPSNAGDSLSILVSSIPAGTLTELLLHDPANNLVAFAEGNTHDGFGSFIDFTTLSTGVFMLDVVPASGLGGATGYSYALTITGNTGGAAFLARTFPAVPEPSTLILLGSGLVGVTGVIRRKHKR